MKGMGVPSISLDVIIFVIITFYVLPFALGLIIGYRWMTAKVLLGLVFFSAFTVATPYLLALEDWLLGTILIFSFPAFVLGLVIGYASRRARRRHKATAQNVKNTEVIIHGNSAFLLVSYLWRLAEMSAREYLIYGKVSFKNCLSWAPSLS